MFDGRKIKIFFSVVFVLLGLFYTGIYFNAKNSGNSVGDNTNYVMDINSVSQNKVQAVQNNIGYYELDSNKNFNPTKPLRRIDAIVIIDKIAKQVLPTYNTTKPSVVPYFEDFKSSDPNGDAVMRVINLIDTKKDFYKHYNILGYKLNRQEAITHREFLNLLSVFIPVNKALGEDYVIKNLINYGFNLDVDLNSKLTREDSAVYVDKIVSSLKK